MSRVFAATLVLLSMFLLACSQAPEQRVERISGPTMGTSYHISIVAQGSVDLSALQAQVDQRLRAINRSMSTYDPSSELSLLNQRQQGGEAQVSDDLAEVLAMALQVNQQSEGAFDVTVGPLVNRWGFGPEQRREPPAADEIAAIRAQLGMDKLTLEGNRLITQVPLYIDLSAVAKGWAVDEIGNLLAEQGFANYLVEIGGEIRAQGQKPDGTHWRIAIERPDLGLEREPQLIVELQDLGLATSGDYRNYYEVDGQRVSHTIDPVTGMPITHKLASVSVIHESTGMADAWATALNVVGPERALSLATQYDLAIYMIVRDGQQYAELMSPAFEHWLEAQASGSK
ncbi:thiamin biosynthesis lipoprotein ApbE [Bacterioplanes sanyensis]|uniref:FAD:protein FMN transferase n=1 Tax=Bacterioplanes sanyensis TaxID=1249553 RepID=UPI00167C1CC6|nr:FAD:protein FMN transferase [Bacterioplanes sanyensis]GGY41122.1 thiamin biosynthesis lipoprotein ApbE [Bacterioplanes sanyensis]